MRDATKSPAFARQLRRLRLRLTLLTAGVFTLILGGLGAGIYLSVKREMSRELDSSLKRATAALEQAASIREVERAQATGPVTDAVLELRIPGYLLYLCDGSGHPLVPTETAPWIVASAQTAAASGRADRDFETPEDRTVRLHAERFTSAGGTAYVAVAVADRQELEDRFAGLIRVFAIAAFAALLLVGAGGWVLVRQSTAPVERAMEQMRRFMADAAHELRTPVTLMRTTADVALGRVREGGADTATLQAMAREAERMGTVVGDLLTLARADAGEWPVVREALYLDDLATEAVDAIRPMAQHRGVALEVGTFDEARITGDPSLVRRLLLILLDNAVKFTPSGGRVRLDISAHDGSRSVVITDTGVGIAAESLPHVFERFYRDAAARQSTDGAGLGLAIARWIADTHAAEIAIASTPGQGTRVAVTFPPAPPKV